MIAALVGLLVALASAVSGVTLNLAFANSNPILLDYFQQFSTNYTAIFPNVKLQFLPLGGDSSISLDFLKNRYFKNDSSTIDVLIMDLVWTGELDPYLMDLSQFPFFPSLRSHYSPELLEGFSCQGRNLAIPLWLDYGLLYYRQDLLQEKGWKIPKTWDELENQARILLNDQRNRGKQNFYGWLFQGRSYEGLTANALEWVASHGGGSFISLNANGERVFTLNNPSAQAAFERASSWMNPIESGGISPPSVLSDSEKDSAETFCSGGAAFMRNFASSLFQCAGNSAVAGKFNVTGLPGLTAKNSGFSTVGSWGAAINAKTRHLAESAQLVAFLASIEVQQYLSFFVNIPPAIQPKYLQRNLTCNPIYSPTACDLLFNGNFTQIWRPTSQLSPNYQMFSTFLFTSVYSILSGSKTASAILSSFRCSLYQLNSAILPSAASDCQSDLPAAGSLDSWVIIVLVLGSAFLIVLGLAWCFLDRRSTRRKEATYKEAIEQAKEANRMKSEFLANMSHEIRTPLNGIIGNAELLEETCQSAEQREFVAQIESSSRHLLTVINDILSFSKLEAGQVELEDRPLDVYQLLEESLHLSFRAGQDEHLEVTYFVDDDVPQFIMGDATRLTQICVNLLGNAFKFTRQGQVTVHVSLLASSTQSVLVTDYKSAGLTSYKPSSRRPTAQAIINHQHQSNHSALSALLNLPNNNNNDRSGSYTGGDLPNFIPDGRVSADSSSPVPQLSIIANLPSSGSNAQTSIFSPLSSPDGILSSHQRHDSSAMQLSDKVSAVDLSDHRNVLTDFDTSSLRPNEFRLQFEIRDTGVGIPIEKQQKLFHAFTQVDATVTREFGGTGLGLTIAEKLSTLMRGRTWLKSELNKGSSFYFTLVSRDGRTALEKQPRLRSKFLLGVPNFPQISRWAVVSIHENESFQQSFRMQANRWGLLPLCTADCNEAISWLSGGNSSIPQSTAKRIKLIIVDSKFTRGEFSHGAAIGAMIREHLVNSGMPTVPMLLLGSVQPLHQTPEQSHPITTAANTPLPGEAPATRPAKVPNQLSRMGSNNDLPSQNRSAPAEPPIELIHRTFFRVVRKPVMFSALRAIIYEAITTHAHAHSAVEHSSVTGASQLPSSPPTLNASLYNTTSLNGKSEQILPSGRVSHQNSISMPNNDANTTTKNNSLAARAPTEAQRRTSTTTSQRSATATPLPMAVPPASSHPTSPTASGPSRESAEPTSSPSPSPVPGSEASNSATLNAPQNTQTSTNPEPKVSNNARAAQAVAPVAVPAVVPVPAIPIPQVSHQVASASVPLSPSPQKLADRFPFRVLLADDDLTNRKLLNRFLIKLGYHANTYSARETLILQALETAGAPQPAYSGAIDLPIDSAANGQEVIDKMKAKHYDIVFMDMQMPKYSGLEATEIINKWYEQREIAVERPIPPYIIALTANALDAHREACLAAGMASYASKPFTIKTLSSLIATAGDAVYDKWRGNAELLNRMAVLKRDVRTLLMESEFPSELNTGSLDEFDWEDPRRIEEQDGEPEN